MDDVNLQIIMNKWTSIVEKWNALVHQKQILVGDLSYNDKVYRFVCNANVAGRCLDQARKL